MADAYDLFVIGAGSGGVRAARIAARLGAKVAICEEYRWGGTCVIRGCVPKKLFVFASRYREAFEDAAGFGWSVAEPAHDWAKLVAAKDAEIARLEAAYGSLLERAGVERIEGRGRIVGPGRVEVAGRAFDAKHVLVATGGRPEKLAIPGAEHAITSNEAFDLTSLPQRILVVGGGYIAVEFAGNLRGLGRDVTLAFRADLPLRGFDDEVRAVLAEEIAKKGVALLSRTTIARIEPHAGAYRVTTGAGDVIETDLVLFATGRVPNTRDLGLEALGVKLDPDGSIAVDAFSHTSVPGVHAVGDVTNRLCLTPVALGEGQALAHTLFGDGPVAFDHADVPTAVFSQPPYAGVGLTEARAREGGRAVDVYVSRFRALQHTVSGRDERCFVKLIVDRASQRVLGFHMIGGDAAEVIQGFAVAVKLKATKAQLDATVGIHPTIAEELVTMRERRADPPS